MYKQLFLSLLIPVIFLALTGGIKSLVKHNVYYSNFYIGIDAALASMANGIINIVELSKGIIYQPNPGKVDLAGRMNNNAIVLVVAFSVLLFVMNVHQRFESPTPIGPSQTWRTRRGIWLGLVANLFGLGSLGIFIYNRLQGNL